MRHENHLLLGIDGGGTGCRAQVEAPDGRRSPVLTDGPANIYSDPDAAFATVTRLARRALEEAQLSGLPDAPVIAVLGLAGATETNAAQRFQAALGFAHTEVTGDLQIALSGTFGSAEGILAALGTGSIFARQTGGKITRLGGYGFVLGDEGSGAWMGRTALTRCLHTRDGLLQAGPLSEALWARFGTLAAVLEFSRAARPADFAALVPEILHHAERGCPIAGAILDDATDWIFRCLGRLQPRSEVLPVAFAGGLGSMFRARMEAQAPLPWPVRAAGSALDGALWQARALAQNGVPYG